MKWIMTAALAVSVAVPAAAKADKTREYDVYPFEDAALDPVTFPELQRFSSEADYRRYIRQLEAIRRKRERRWVQGETSIRLAQDGPVTADQMPCDPAKGECPEELGDVVVTAQRASSPPAASITNVQSLGVDEGDIVKQIGHYLITLQDGRLFVVDMNGNRLTDRFDVYRRDADGDLVGADWYDEMLVEDDHIVVTAYSYEDSATELSVFSLDQGSGKVSRVGVFLLSSDDYYSARNYASRIVGDKLVLYAPYEADQFLDRSGRPTIRKWLPQADREAAQAEGTPVFSADEIWKPVIRTGQPTIHTVTICPLGKLTAGSMLSCKATAIVGPSHAEMYVSPQAVYLWTTANRESWGWDKPDCSAEQQDQPPVRDTIPGAIYRFGLDDEAPLVLAARGGPGNQFAMDEEQGRFRGLAIQRNFRCEQSEGRTGIPLTLYQPAPEEFGDFYDPDAPATGRKVPIARVNRLEQRFAGEWLVYGGRDGWSGYPPDDADYDDKSTPVAFGNAVAVPLRHPGDAQIMPIDHSVIRIERVGADRVVLTGYHDAAGLEFTMLGLSKKAAIVGRATLPKRFESEGRSHAFNATVAEDGSGLLGIPTVLDEDGQGRWWWRSQSSDLSFLRMSKSGALASAGELSATPEDQVAVAQGYTCEVSCIDWYGNSRPIFTGRRIFGLMGTELVEARLDDGGIEELGRLDLTGPVGNVAGPAKVFAKPDAKR